MARKGRGGPVMRATGDEGVRPYGKTHSEVCGVRGGCIHSPHSLTGDGRSSFTCNISISSVSIVHYAPYH